MIFKRPLSLAEHAMLTVCVALVSIVGYCALLYAF